MSYLQKAMNNTTIRNWGSECSSEDFTNIKNDNLQKECDESVMAKYNKLSFESQQFIDEIMETNEDDITLLKTYLDNIKINNNKEELKLVEVCNENYISVKPKKNNKTSESIINNRTNVYTLEEFRNCISKENKLKGCVRGWDCSNKNCKKFYHIHPSAQCYHTYNGTLCDNVINCNKIHIQRCLNEIDHYYNGQLIKATECQNKNKWCSFIHKSNLQNIEAQQAFENSMDEYKKKKPKQFSN